MRIAYENIIDSLSSASIVASSADANYPVTNIKDERLTTQWLTDTASSQSVTFTLDTFPEYPDNSTGTILSATFNATAETWVGVGGVATVGTYLGCISMVATTAGSRIERTGPAIASGSTIMLRARSTTAAATSFSLIFGATTSTAITTLSGMTTSFSILQGIVAGTSTALTSIRLIPNNISSSGSVFDIDWLYIGTGAYTTQIQDNSENNLDLTVFGSLKSQGYIIRNGVNDYERTTSVLSVFPDILHYHEEMPNGDALDAVNTKIYFNYKEASATVGFTYVYRTNNTNTLQVKYCNGAATANVDFANYFTGYSITRIVIDVDINWITGVVTVYRNGAYFGTATMTTPVKPTAGSYMYFGSYQGTQYFAAGTFYKPLLYNRALSTDEIEHLYNSEPFATENMGLVGDWTLDKNYKVNTASILGHNILSGTMVKVEANNSDEWGAPSVSETFTYIASGNTILRFLADNYYYKYWKISITGQGSVQIGRIWLGDYLTISPSSLLDFKVTLLNSDMVIHGINRQKWSNPGVTWRRFELSFPESEHTMVKQLEDMYRDVGNHSSILFMNFDTLREFQIVEPCYCSINGELSFNHSNRQKYRYSITLEEEL
jgi:hypothetical protein